VRGISPPGSADAASRSTAVIRGGGRAFQCSGGSPPPNSGAHPSQTLQAVPEFVGEGGEAFRMKLGTREPMRATDRKLARELRFIRLAPEVPSNGEPAPGAVRDGNASEHDTPIRLDNDSRTECKGNRSWCRLAVAAERY
jgi:hypothetical protein